MNRHTPFTICYWVSIALCLSLLNGCGFHLRGKIELPESLQALKLQTPNSNNQLARELQRTLKRNDIAVSENASTVLNILNETTKKRTIALDSRGKSGQYEITQTVSFSVTNQDKRELLPATDIQISRSYRYSELEVSAKDEEENLILKEINQALVRRILNSLSTIK